MAATAESANEGAAPADAANTQQNGNGLDKINFDRNLVNICVNVNANEQIRITEPETGSLTVNKQVFGCNISAEFGTMNCQLLQNGDSEWLPCIGSSISGTGFCQGLPPNIFEIEVLDDQRVHNYNSLKEVPGDNNPKSTTRYLCSKRDKKSE